MLKYALIIAITMGSVFPDSSRVSEVSATKGLMAFLQSMAQWESENNPHAVNRFGMLGKYQFHPHTLKEIGIRTTRKHFLNDEALQDSAMVLYMKANWEELHDVIQHWSGKRVHGILVTESGIVASAHFSGTVGVRAFFNPKKYHKKLSDANGATVAMYMKKFSNFSLGF